MSATARVTSARKWQNRMRAEGRCVRCGACRACGFSDRLFPEQAQRRKHACPGFKPDLTQRRESKLHCRVCRAKCRASAAKKRHVTVTA